MVTMFDRVPHEEHSSEWDSANFWEKWTFSVANQLLDTGTKKKLQLDDLLHLSNHDSTEKIIHNLKYCYERSKEFSFLPRLLIAMLTSFPREHALIVFFTLVEGATRVALPAILRLLLNSLGNGSSDRTTFGWAALLGGLSLVQCFVHHVLFFLTMRLGWNWKISTTGLIFDRLFKLNTASVSQFDTGKLVNLISNDVARFEEFSVFFCFFWETYLELAGILGVLIWIVGIPAGFSGVGVTLLLIPLQMALAKKFARYRGQTAAATDHRVRYISEIIDGVGSVKSYGWEVPFFDLISKLRIVETQHISSSQTLRSINQGLFYCTPAIASFVTFSVFWGLGGTLTLPIVFSTLSLLQTLRMTVGRQWTRSIETGSEAIASCQRIEKYLNFVDTTLETPKLENGSFSAINEDSVEMVKQESENVSPNMLEFCNCSFYYGNNSSQCVLKNLKFAVSRGELVTVVGPVGAGKSSLLAAILGEINHDSSSGPFLSNFRGKHSLAYCSQRAWILAASVRANIAMAGQQDGMLSGNFKDPVNLNKDLYQTALESCRIVDDLKMWPDYDKTEIGERGISISGGQKARISLARAVYSDADLYLLDDPLSACDAHVGKDLFFECIINTLRGRGKSVILVTHQLQYLKYSDKILLLDQNGHQEFFGDFSTLRQSRDCLLKLSLNIAEETSEDPVLIAPDVEIEIEEKVEIAEKPDVSEPSSNETPIKTETGPPKSIIQAEDRIEGRMSFDLLWKYLKSGGTFRGLCTLAVAIFAQGALMIDEYWLRFWAGERFGSQNKNLYIYIFAMLTAVCIVVGFLRAIMWFRFTLRASSSLHERSLWAVFHSPLQFFVANPTGRILNRFSRDQNQADELLPVTLFDFIQCSLFCLAAVILVCISIPWLTLVMPPLILFFFWARGRYIQSTREIKRIEAITRSPIYADFSATLEGLTTLRAYDLRVPFTAMFFRELSENGRASFSFLMCARWLGFRLDLMSSFLVIAVALVAVALRHQIDIGLIGFSLVYTISLSGLFQWTVRQSVEVEAQMTAIERIAHYGNLPSEHGYSIGLEDYHQCHQQLLKPKSNDGHSDPLKQLGSLVELNHLTVTYREDLDPVLKDIVCSFPAGSKIGVCGRTGSGKSSTLLALLRLNIISEGDIYVDGESLLAMNLEKARSIISVIPQDPHLFSGTVRFNLDPFNQCTDEQIWAALRDAHIADYISKCEGGLNFNVEESGKNFSVGQRQLLSLARAILRRTSIVLMDEVTASIDYHTDKLIQQTIRSSPSLKDSTIITVAHRLRTIADSDLVVVIHNGTLVELGPPSELLQKEGSPFRALAQESNEFDDIAQIAKDAYYRKK